jgi:hypothetical protein
MTKDEANKFIQSLPYEAVLIYDALWIGPDLLAVTDKLDKLAQDAAAASEAIKQLKIYKPAA